MKTKNEIIKEMYTTIYELENNPEAQELPRLRTYLLNKLSVLNDILGDDVPEEFWDKLENKYNLL